MKLNTCAVALLAMASLATAALAPAAAADVPDGKRVPHTTETQSTGKPTNPRGWGSITSQRARNEGDIGTHVSAQEKPHQGVGNVARNDQDVADALGTPNTGSHVSDHADTVGPVVGYDPNVRPGTKEEEETNDRGPFAEHPGRRDRCPHDVGHPRWPRTPAWRRPRPLRRAPCRRDRCPHDVGHPRGQ